MTFSRPSAASEPVRPLSSLRRRTLRAAAVALTVVVAAGAVGGAWLVDSAGPAYSLQQPAQSPQAYGSRILSLMDNGIHATGPEWAEARAEASERIERAATHDEVDAILADALPVAGGKHSFMMESDDHQKAIDSYTPPTSSMEGCVLTVTLPAYMGSAEQGEDYATTLADALETEGVCGVVVDLRENGGGDMGPMIAGLSPLLPDGVVTSFVFGSRTSDVTLEDGEVCGGGTPTSVGPRPKLDAPVAVLTSSGTASSESRHFWPSAAWRTPESSERRPRATPRSTSRSRSTPAAPWCSRSARRGPEPARTSARHRSHPTSRPRRRRRPRPQPRGSPPAPEHRNGS